MAESTQCPSCHGLGNVSYPCDACGGSLRERIPLSYGYVPGAQIFGDFSSRSWQLIPYRKCRPWYQTWPTGKPWRSCSNCHGSGKINPNTNSVMFQKALEPKGQRLPSRSPIEYQNPTLQTLRRGRNGSFVPVAPMIRSMRR